MQNFNWKLFIALVILGAIGVFAIIPYELAMFNVSELPPEAAELNREVVAVINSFAQVFLVIVSVFIGMLTMKRTQLKAPFIEAIVAKEKMPAISWKWVNLAVGVSFVGSLLVLVLDRYVFMPQIILPGGANISPTWWHGLLAMFYGGITEELLVRVFIMGLIIWLLAVIFRKQAGEIPRSFYYIGIVGAALLFGIGHLPATAQLFGGLSSLLITRALLLNSLLGLWFGFLYYRKGLEYAIIAHMSADLFIHVIFTPLLG